MYSGEGLNFRYHLAFSSSAVDLCNSPPTYGNFMPHSFLVFKAQLMQDHTPETSLLSPLSVTLHPTHLLKQHSHAGLSPYAHFFHTLLS